MTNRTGRPLKGTNAIPPPGYRWCSKCSQMKPESEFYRSPRGRWAAYCRPCTRQIDKLRKRPNRSRNKYNNLRQRILDAYGNACQECGEADPGVLQIHHVDHELGRKHHRDGWSNSRYYRYALQELDAYELLCRNCHRKKHRRTPRID